MTKKKLNWRNILNTMMASVSLVLVALIISMGFITPKDNHTIKALTKQDILETYNVSFVSAKTKYRVANAFKLSDDIVNGKSYMYEYPNTSAESELYKETTANSEYGSEYGMSSIQNADGDEIRQYVKLTSSYPYIPSTATHLKNVTTKKLEKVFYDAFDNGDFVILDDNYIVPTRPDNANFNVENVYIGFGSLDDEVKLNEIKVQGTLQNATGTYSLNLNQEKRYGDSTETPPYSCWYQYFDVNNTYATTTPEQGSQTYKVADASGLYTLTFTFGRQVKDGETVGNGVSVKDGFTVGETFTYSFYLLNSSDYSNYPTIKDATLGSTLENEVDEYFYHFESKNPSIIYSPDRFNLSYTRQNNEILDSIITSFATGKYIVDGINEQYGKITFYNNNQYLKDVYIFTNYSSDKKVLEFIYASTKNSNISFTNYEDVVALIENNTLAFEYKLVKALTQETVDTAATFTTKTYYTNDYTHYAFDVNSFNVSNYSNYENYIATTVDNVTIADGKYSYTTAGKTMSELKRLLNPDTIDLDYTYMLNFDDLGIYNFSYSYVAQWYSNDGSVVKTNYTASSSIVPKDYTLTYVADGDTESESTNKGLNIVISGYLNEQNSVNLLNHTFTYSKNEQQPLADKNGNHFVFDTAYQISIGSVDINGVRFSLETEETRLKLVMTIPVGSITITNLEDVSKTTTSHNKKHIYQTIYDYELTAIHSANISTSVESLSYLRKLLENIETQDNKEANKFYPVESTAYKTHTLGKDKLTIFGSVAYFSKVNTTTDSGYSKLEQVDSKEKKNYISDYTSMYVTRYGGQGLLSSTTPSAGFSKNLGLTIDKLIVTDTQVFWKNYSSLLYGTGDNNKVSQSKIYRYTNYKDTSGNLDLDNASMSEYSNKNTYFKDIYCKDDGYYEVIIKYTYNFYKSSNAIHASTSFYQLFVFIIDNSSPQLTFEQQTLDSDNTPIYTNLLPNSYTNKIVRISWPVPTYFKNNIYIEVTKTNFEGNTSDLPFVAKFDGATGITVKSGSEAYVRGISELEKSVDKNTYYVTFRLPENTSWNLDGHYSVKLYYGPENIDGSKPNLTQKYTSDNKDITGMRVLPVIKNDSGAYVVNEDLMTTLKANAQILNTDFTFRYSAKASGAKITTYFHKISLDVTADYNKLIHVDDSTLGITTNYYVNGTGEEITSGVGTQYKYNYDTGNTITNANFLSSNSSCIYLFKMQDEAGNEARYVVFYDTTSPRFIVSPLPTGSNNIVSDVTSIMWGDYKAIKISGLGVSDNLIEGLDNYSEISNNNKLIETLSYINNLSNSGIFNNTTVKKIGSDYYLLIPIVKAQISDEDGNNKEVKDTTSYYLFPTSPLEEGNKIGLPTHDTNGNVIMEAGKIKQTLFVYSNIEVEQTRDYFGDISREYIKATLTNGNIVRGVNGTGLYYYSIYDELGNSNLGDLWMNLDKTQTLAYATFNYTDNLSKATGLTGESASTYAISKLYISSLENTSQENMVIPKYSITYSYFAYDAEFYNNNQITGVRYVTSEIEGDQSAYLEFTFRNATDPSTEVTRKMQIYDRLGNRIQPVSYPYSMKSTSSESDETKNIYINTGYASRTDSVDANIKRVYSDVINKTKNTSNGQSVTKEGLYIFKREYDSSVDDSTLGNDSRIIYRVYYVDRSGIISYIPTSQNTANALYGTGNDIEFLLGSNYSGKSLANQKLISASNIQNNQKSVGSDNSSNTTYTSYDLFSTNKVQTKFTLTLDKFNYSKFAQNYSSLADTYAENTELKNALNNYLLNSALFTSLFKLDLTLYKGTNGAKIIDETNMDASMRYNSSLMSKYIDEYSSSTNITSRGNELSFFYGDSLNSYYVTLNDQSGHIERTYNADTNTYETTSINAGSNSLDISFMIKHVAPSGELYGKYYGNPSISYDENENDSQAPSIPIASEDNGEQKKGDYLLISKYLNDSKGSLKNLSSSQNIVTTKDGSTVTVSSTNNETLVFLFAITNDDYMAKIDTNNIQVYQNGTTPSHLIFNRYEENGDVFNHTTALVPSQDRQNGSFICNVIGDVTYYAIIIFDNNLDDILDEDEASFGNHRLLDSDNNPDEATYYIRIHYIGEKDDYNAELNGETVSYYSSTYQIEVDRIKPTYNLVRLMELDKYTYKGNTSATPVTDTNYQTMFDYYDNYYNFKYNEETKFTNSDLEKYFFAVDSRESTSFVFKSINKKDSNGGFYIRPLGTDISNYKFSYTPDDYTIYNNAELRGEHNQFMPDDKIDILFNGSTIYSPSKFETNKYYYCPYIDGEMSANLMLNQGIVKANNYYEIIEWDEAGNYRVYGIYIHDASSDSVSYQYQTYNGNNYNSNAINYGNSVALVSGISFSIFKNGFTDYAYITNDLFIKAQIKITSNNINETLYLYYQPYENILKLTDSNNQTKETIENVSNYKSDFVTIINRIISNYKSKVLDTYGYTIEISIIDRLGIPATYDRTILNNFVITYSVAGIELKPIFATSNTGTTFIMTIPAQQGSTYITSVEASEFNQTWIDKDIDYRGIQFRQHVNELKKGVKFELGTGVYRFVIKDNFGRSSIYFYEFGISSSSTGGSISYYGNHATHTDGFNYTYDNFTYKFDSKTYKVFIRYTGENLNSEEFVTSEEIYGPNSSYSINDLNQFGINSIITTGNITEITFMGVKGSRFISKYEIKAILASTADGYEWGDEENNSNIFVYDNKVAIQKAIRHVSVRNLKGISLDTSTNLYLTDDFQLVLDWGNVLNAERIDFNAQILLTRSYEENGVSKTTSFKVSSGYIVTLPGVYTAKAINDLGNSSDTITFTRDEGEISLSALYAVSEYGKVQSKLNASAYSTIAGDGKTEYHYFITDDYFTYIDAILGDPITSDFGEIDPSIITINKKAEKYLDIRVNSNLNLVANIIELDPDGYGDYDYEHVIVYQISTASEVEGTPFVYRYLVIHFLPHGATTLVDTNVNDVGSSTDKVIENGIVQSISKNGVNITFTQLTNVHDNYWFVVGNTLFIDRYYNGNFVETIVLNTLNAETEKISYTFTITTVGLHYFRVRDLAGREHIFNTSAPTQNNSNLLSVYLINQVLYQVNDTTPINNQVFNEAVKIRVISRINGLTLYNTDSLGITVYKNGTPISLPIENGVISISEQGFYTISIVAITQLSSNYISNQEVSSTYNFVIIRDDIAKNSFSVSKGTNFIIDKVQKTIAGETYDMTEEFKESPNGISDGNGNYSSSLIWLTYNEQQNSKYAITLKAYNVATGVYDTFSFNVWINDTKPTIHSNIKAGEQTRDTIELYFNAGLIYEEVGVCRLEINGATYFTIDKDSETVVSTLTIENAGEYNIKIVSDDGSVLCSYKFIKVNPINSTTKFILIIASIAVVVVVVLFFLIRKKGKYR